MKLKGLTLGVALSSALVASFASANTVSLSTLKSMDNTFVSKTTDILQAQDEEAARYKAIEQIGLTIGAQHGYADRIGQLKNKMSEIGPYLDQSIDFRQVMLAASGEELELFLLPPVVIEVDGVAAVSEDNTVLRVTGKTFAIKEKEKLVLAAPTWREYLLLDRDVETKKPHPSMLPKNAQEKEIWSSAVERGWNAGAIQADHEMNDRIAELQTDYIGMIRYMRLVREGKIKQPVIAKIHENVLGGGDQMLVNDVTYRLTSDSQLISDVKYWKPLVIDTREGYRYEHE